ncbi:iron transport multicopper oxidase FET3 precursor [Massarina eburnea CBS 473.64]|uniref:Iron transport multicopper oxidase FET3 n=1 Tax=Massarina eburnea CBS 473.64 TaxID=1395130 RepID=A0A6A6S4F0_9PLEO|nr:iron transport multicopper oxidase FET3 precursor [Massarina eburnea CBS 473.64]
MLPLSTFLFPVSLLSTLAFCATVTYDFDVSWVYANPDGLQTRPVIGINGQWPVPTIRVTKGDQLVVNVKNSLGNQTTSIHFHGLYQNGTTHMDGPTQVSQCAIQPGESFTYNTTVDQPGTYWYHSHVRGQYPDGLRGPLIVTDPEDPHKSLYDEELVLSFSDWYHDSMTDLLASFINIANPSGAEPVPDSALVNETQNLGVKVQPGKTYMIRMVNVGAFAAQYVWFEDHTMRVVEVDGIYTEPTDADMIYLAAAQRYSVLITAKNSTEQNFAFVGSMDQDLFDTVPATLNPNVTGWLVYDDNKDKPAPKTLDSFEPFDDFSLVPQDKEDLYDHVDHTIQLDMKMDNLDDGANYAFFNDVTWIAPKVPTLYTVLSTGANATNPLIYGSNTNQFVLQANEVVEIILNNDDPGKHPFHLHGHAFQVIHRSDEDSGFYNPTNTPPFPRTPMRRDTVLVHPNANMVLRFRSDNPGVWLFHCHIEWHVASGLIATIIESPLDIQRQLVGSIPRDHLDACRTARVPIAGNAAGNTRDLLDLTGENSAPGYLPGGFTARGVVALVFSCGVAVLGMGVIGGYGMAPIKAKTG